MTTQETLKSPEILAPSLQENQTENSVISKEEVQEIYAERKNRLEKVKSFVCLKFYNDISEKLDSEKRQLEQLLNLQDARDEALSHYSFVLNPYYFEQKFIGAEI